MPKAPTPPPASYPTHGFCGCGCGHKTTIADRNIPGANRFKGYPRLYIRGHNMIGKKRELPSREPGAPRICECGCGQSFSREVRHGAPIRFIPGHHLAMPIVREKVLATKRRQRVQPVVIHSGICLCGCGQATQISTYTSVRYNFYVGLPTLYIPGHRPHRKGPDNGNFIGRRTSAQGYVYIYRPDHPAALKTTTWKGYIAEHRIVLEQGLGRFLLPNEHGHHINGIRDDNRPENLIALTRGEHRRLHKPNDKCDVETRRKLSEHMRRIWAERHANA